jgi:hypothetical protein
MRSRAAIFISILAPFAAIAVQAAPDCSNRIAPQSLPLAPTALPALSPELSAIAHRPGSAAGVLAYSSDETQAVDRVLQRLRYEGCQNVSRASGYVPKTKWDNTPYRFNAGGNGKKFTAADFDAWMKANGIHIAKGAPQPAPAADPGLSAQPVK